ncbi:TPA: hypothetical protein U8251_000016 [Pseudomonas putida]|nr:hypothetical protein [Pseudomonas putida]
MILPFTIFFTVLIVGTIGDYFGLQGGWKIGLLLPGGSRRADRSQRVSTFTAAVK